MGKQHDDHKHIKPRDGYDNTGTQGYDSLTDDAFTGSSDKPAQHPGETESGTGSSSADFPTTDEEKENETE